MAPAMLVSTGILLGDLTWQEAQDLTHAMSSERCPDMPGSLRLQVTRHTRSLQLPLVEAGWLDGRSSYNTWHMPGSCTSMLKSAAL